MISKSVKIDSAIISYTSKQQMIVIQLSVIMLQKEIWLVQVDQRLLYWLPDGVFIEKGVSRFVRARASVCIKVKNVGYTFYKRRNYWLLFISHLSTLTNFLISSSFWNIPRKHICKMPEYFLCKTNAILNDDEVYDTKFVNRNIALCSNWRFAKCRKQRETRILSMLYLLW